MGAHANDKYDWIVWNTRTRSIVDIGTETYCKTRAKRDNIELNTDEYEARAVGLYM